MRVIPVIDLMHGQVVRGVAGQRENYRPVESRIAADPTPHAIAKAFIEQFAFSEVYIADLDALGGAEPDWESLEAIARCGLRLWLDAGITNAKRAKQIRARSAELSIELSGVIVGLESVDSPSSLQSIFRAIDARDAAVFSVDLKDGKPLTTAASWQEMTSLEIARVAVEMGFWRLIVLDLAHVGSGQGVGIASFCRSLRETFPHVQLVSGGGVRNFADLEKLADAGCDAALVASALHDGSLTPSAIEQLDFGQKRPGRARRPRR